MSALHQNTVEILFFSAMGKKVDDITLRLEYRIFL